MIPRPPISTLFPYTTLFRSKVHLQLALAQPVEGIAIHDPGELAAIVFAQQIAHAGGEHIRDRKSTRLNSSHANISYAVFCLKKKKKNKPVISTHETTINYPH